MEFDYILTFDKPDGSGKDQQFGKDEIAPFFPRKEDAVVYFTTLVSDQDRHLIKVSICAHSSGPIPIWFTKANGKLWSDDLGTERHNPYLRRKAGRVR